MQYLLIGFIIFIALFLQGSVTTAPLVLLILLLLYIYMRQEWVFFVAFLSGILLDILSVGTIGMSSLYFLFFLFAVFLYQRKFEIGSYYFIFFSLWIGTVFYTLLFGIANGIMMAFILGFLGVGGFWIVRKTGAKKKSVYF